MPGPLVEVDCHICGAFLSRDEEKIQRSKTGRSYCSACKPRRSATNTIDQTAVGRWFFQKRVGKGRAFRREYRVTEIDELTGTLVGMSLSGNRDVFLTTQVEFLIEETDDPPHDSHDT